MQNTHFKRSIFTILAALTLAALACNMPATRLGQTVLETQAPIEQPAASPGGSALTLTLTADDVNAIIDNALQNQPGLPVKSLQIVLDNGQLNAAGVVRQGTVNLPINITATASADGQGGVSFRITNATLGPFPLPAEYLTQVNSMLNEGLKQPIADATEHMFIESIVIDNGVATVSGRASD